MAKQKKTTEKKHRTFHAHLILNRWILSLLGQNSFEDLKKALKDNDLIGLNNEGQTLFFEALKDVFSKKISEEDFRRYDLNIVKHWQTITEKRNQASGHQLQMKYFQYLSLLFTEIYLDWFVHRTEAMLAGLNQTLASYKQENDIRLSSGRFKQNRLLECHRLGQNLADARQYFAISALLP